MLKVLYGTIDANKVKGLLCIMYPNPCEAGRTCRYHTTEASHSVQGCGTNLITKLAKVHLENEQNGVEVRV